MRTLILPALLVLAAVLCLHRAFQSIAYADDAGSGSSMTAPVSAPTVDQLPDPTHSPLAAVTAEKALWHYGWALGLFGALIMGLQILVWVRTALTSVPLLGKLASWLAVQKRVVWVSALSIGAVAGYNALLAGGTWFAALILLGGKLLALVNFGTPQPPQS